MPSKGTPNLADQSFKVRNFLPLATVPHSLMMHAVSGAHQLLSAIDYHFKSTAYPLEGGVIKSSTHTHATNAYAM